MGDKDHTEEGSVLPEQGYSHFPNLYHARCGTGHAANRKSACTCGIYLSEEGSGKKADRLSPFCMDMFRMRAGQAGFFDVQILNPQTGECFPLENATAKDIALAIHLRSGGPLDPLTRAVFALLSERCYEVEGLEEEGIQIEKE